VLSIKGKQAKLSRYIFQQVWDSQ